jgi:hypothetical protein
MFVEMFVEMFVKEEIFVEIDERFAGGFADLERWQLWDIGGSFHLKEFDSRIKSATSTTFRQAHANLLGNCPRDSHRDTARRQ